MSGDLNKRIARFLEIFELVFEYDWDYSKAGINDKYLINDEGTFLNPYPGEHFTGGKGDNWANRSSLISAYRELKAFGISEGIIGEFDDPEYGIQYIYLDDSGSQQNLHDYEN